MLDKRYSFQYITIMPKKMEDRKRRKSTSGFKGRIWIDGTQGTFIGYGRVSLLEKIMEHGSITRAAKSLDMAYRQAWILVDSMNRQAREPFVEVSTGGKGGGGTKVTEAGKKAVKQFRRFHEDFQEFLRREEKKIKLLAKPLQGKLTGNKNKTR